MKWFKQHDSRDCGPTCLRMVAKYYNKNISQQYLREKTQMGKKGANLLGITEAAEAIGLKTQSIKADLDTLRSQIQLPAILYWNQNHFVVLYKIKKDKFFIADPSKGLITYNSGEIKSHWSSDTQDKGIVVELQPSTFFFSSKFDDSNSKNDTGVINFFRYVKPYKKLVFQLLIGMIITSFIQLALPFLTISIIDTGISVGDINFITLVLFGQFALLAGKIAIEFVRNWISLHVSTRINITILTDFLVKLMSLPISFYDSKNTGDILQRMGDHSRIESFLTGSSLNTFFSLINLIIFSFVLIIINKYIFIVFVISNILYTAWVVFFLKKRRELDYKRFAFASQERNATIQLIQGMQEVKLNGVEKLMRYNWERIQTKLFKVSMQVLSINQIQRSGAFLINEGKNIIITFLSAKSVIDGHMTLGSMLAVQYIIGQLNSPVEQMISFLQSWQNAKISIERLNEVHGLDDEEPKDRLFLKEIPKIFQRKVNNYGRGIIVSTKHHAQRSEDLILDSYPDMPSKEDQLNTNGYSLEDNNSLTSIDLKNVSFTYPGVGNESVLKDISISIPKGKTTAIVGVSGSGKTTLLKMLLKFYEPQIGEIKLDKVSLANISHKSWREHCGVVMQESYIFSDTIAKNIAMNSESIDFSRLNSAINIANIRDFVEDLPMGYNTRIGSEGVGISAGQKQRILIARAVYKDPDFIFFDEATNSLDSNNESKIINNLNSFFKGRTVIIVAHRLSTVKNADQIIVLNKGKVSERGSHRELVNLKGEYFSLIENQLDLGT